MSITLLRQILRHNVDVDYVITQTITPKHKLCPLRYHAKYYAKT